MIHEDDIIVGQKVQILKGDFRGLDGSIIDFKMDENGNLLNDEIEVHIKDSNMVKFINKKDLRLLDPWQSFDKRLNYRNEGPRIKPIREKKIVNEQDGGVFSEAHARELLAVQADYNKKIQQLNTELAKKKSDLSIKYMKIVQQQDAQKTAQQQARQNVAQAHQTQQTPQTGTVDTSGRPVTSSGTPPPIIDSYGGILKIKKTLNDSFSIDRKFKPGEEEMFTRQLHQKDTRNWYEKQRAEKEEKERLKSLPRKKKWTQKQSDKEEDLSDQINQLDSEIKYLKDRLNPEMSWEMEEFLAEVGFEAADVLNSGISDSDKIVELTKLGVSNPQSILREYQGYYPSDAEKSKIEQQLMELSNEKNKLQIELDQLYKMYESLNESIYNVANADVQELQKLKDYLDAEGISYIEDDEAETLEFDDEEIDDEWKEQLDVMGLEKDDTSDILSIGDEDEDEDDIDDEEILTDEDEQIDKDKVIYVRIDDNGNTVVGKIYKLFDDGEWRSKIVNGESDTFEKLNYDPEWDEIDIVAFLRDNYEDADSIEENEYDEYLGESWAAAAKIAGVVAAKEMTDKLMDEDEEVYEDEEEITEVCEDEEEITESHSIPTLDDFMKIKS